MKNLKFFMIELDYVKFLKRAEQQKRGFSRVPNMEYDCDRKPKFLCGIVLQIHNQDYYVPVSSYKKKKPDNFLIRAESGKVVSSLRFNYMFPIPKDILVEKNIYQERDRSYRRLLAQELRYCIKNQDTIRRLAERTYKQVLLGKNLGLVKNSCDFLLLEEQCAAYMRSRKISLQEQIKEAQTQQASSKQETLENPKFQLQTL